MKGCENDHYYCQVVLQLQGFVINLIYMKRQVPTVAIAGAWLLLIVYILFCGKPIQVRAEHS